MCWKYYSVKCTFSFFFYFFIYYFLLLLLLFFFFFCRFVNCTLLTIASRCCHLDLLSTKDSSARKRFTLPKIRNKKETGFYSGNSKENSNYDIQLPSNDVIRSVCGILYYIYTPSVIIKIYFYCLQDLLFHFQIFYHIFPWTKASKPQLVVYACSLVREREVAQVGTLRV